MAEPSLGYRTPALIAALVIAFSVVVVVIVEQTGSNSEETTTGQTPESAWAVPTISAEAVTSAGISADATAACALPGGDWGRLAAAETWRAVKSSIFADERCALHGVAVAEAWLQRDISLVTICEAEIIAWARLVSLTTNLTSPEGSDGFRAAFMHYVPDLAIPFAQIIRTGAFSTTTQISTLATQFSAAYFHARAGDGRLRARGLARGFCNSVLTPSNAPPVEDDAALVLLSDAWPTSDPGLALTSVPESFRLAALGRELGPIYILGTDSAALSAAALGVAALAPTAVAVNVSQAQPGGSISSHLQWACANAAVQPSPAAAVFVGEFAVDAAHWQAFSGCSWGVPHVVWALAPSGASFENTAAAARAAAAQSAMAFRAVHVDARPPSGNETSTDDGSVALARASAFFRTAMNAGFSRRGVHADMHLPWNPPAGGLLLGAGADFSAVLRLAGGIPALPPMGIIMPSEKRLTEGSGGRPPPGASSNQIKNAGAEYTRTSECLPPASQQPPACAGTAAAAYLYVAAHALCSEQLTPTQKKGRALGLSIDHLEHCACAAACCEGLAPLEYLNAFASTRGVVLASAYPRDTDAVVPCLRHRYSPVNASTPRDVVLHMSERNFRRLGSAATVPSVRVHLIKASLLYLPLLVSFAVTDDIAAIYASQWPVATSDIYVPAPARGAVWGVAAGVLVGWLTAPDGRLLWRVRPVGWESSVPVDLLFPDSAGYGVESTATRVGPSHVSVRTSPGEAKFPARTLDTPVYHQRFPLDSAG